MRFYYIWAKLFSFELKNTNKIDIKNMNPENAIKIINIQKSYPVLFSPLWFYSVQIGPIWSILSSSVLFSRHWSSLVHYGPIRSNMSTLFLICPLALFSPHWSTLSYLVHFGLIRSYFVHSVHFVPFSLFGSTSINSDHFDLF